MTDVLREFLDADGKRVQGPWNLVLPDAGEAQLFSVVDVEERGTVADCYNYTDAEDRANAEFIAAASKIAPALRALLDEVEGLRVEVRALRYQLAAPLRLLRGG